MPLNPVALPVFHDNYIWCLHDDGHALVVDPGDADAVEHWLAQENLQLDSILLTHHHADHTGGVAALIAHHHPQVYGPPEDIDGITRLLSGGEVLTLEHFGTAAVMAVPGHTRAHIAYYLPDAGLLFCGDTLFSAGCGRLFEGTAAQLHASLQKILQLPDSTRICCTHEYTAANLRFAAVVEPENAALQQWNDTVSRLRANGQPSLPVRLGEERRYNPFLRCEEPAVIASAAREAGHPLAAGLDTFTALRLWKDRF